MWLHKDQENASRLLIPLRRHFNVQSCSFPIRSVEAVVELSHGFSKKCPAFKSPGGRITPRRHWLTSLQLLAFFLKQWPCPEPSLVGFAEPEDPLIDISPALEIIRPEWQRLFQNYQFSQYVTKVQQTLDQHHSEIQAKVPVKGLTEQNIIPTRCSGGELPTLQDLLLVQYDCPEIPTLLDTFQVGISFSFRVAIVTQTVTKWD